MNLTIINNIILGTLLIACVITDLKERRIPNRITINVILLTILLNAIMAGSDGAAFSLSGAAAGAGLMFLPYMFGGVGGGDLKMMAAVGAITGVRIAVISFLFTAIAGALVVVVCSIHQKVVSHSSNLETAGSSFRTSHMLIDGTGGIAKEKSTIPYACAIAAGTVAAVILGPYMPL